ncbi:MAG: thiopurine S-methyltransferase [Gammaproteobacteria bacterium]
MEPNFWLARWKHNEIGFHEQAIHPLLPKHWPTVAGKTHTKTAAGNDDGAARKVFVPLCGKSRDMLWFIEQGYEVYGVELSAVGVEAFFDENNLACEKTVDGKLVKYVGAGVTLWCGDIFILQRSQLPPISLFYDRAALVALPGEMRGRYVHKLATLLAENARGLLIALEYAEHLLNPPPHSLDSDTVRKTCHGLFETRLLGSGDGEVKGHPCTEHAFLLEACA